MHISMVGTTHNDKTEKVGITLPNSLMKQTDNLRGDIPRSTLSAMKGCNKSTIVKSPIDTKWFCKISKLGLCIDKKDLHKIIEDPNMPREL